MRRLDEHTETTLMRVSLNEPVPAAALADAARVLIAAWTDPADPENQLKRPAKCQCFHCGGTYISRLQLLARSIYCSPECKVASAAKAREILGNLAAQAS